MRSAKRVTWAVLSGVIGIGLVAIVSALVFVSSGRSRPVNPGAALSELISWGDTADLRVTAIGSAPLGASTPRDTPNSAAAVGDLPGEPVAIASPRSSGSPASTTEGSAAVVVLAALPDPTGTGTPTTTEPTATAASTAPPTTTSTQADQATAPPEPPPGAQYGVTYCGPNPCGVGLKCCCESCVPFEQACDPRSCAAQSGLSISVPCGMDLCDPGEICCDARCGECARLGECPEEPCK